MLLLLVVLLDNVLRWVPWVILVLVGYAVLASSILRRQVIEMCGMA